MTKKFSKSEIEQAKVDLREIIKPGDTIYTIVRHVSRSGMYRSISLFAMVGGELRDISLKAANGCAVSAYGITRNHIGPE